MEKILAFIIMESRLLLLLGSNKDPQFHKSFWYTVTGAKELYDNSLEDTVIREIKEETNLDVEKIINLDWIFKYESLGNYCTEHAFIAYVAGDNIILNEESIDYKWCDFNTFISEINWFYDKNELKEKLEKYIGEKNEDK